MPSPPRLPEEPRLPDPGAMPDPGVLHATEQTRTYPCPACGGMLAFEPERDRLQCQHCGTEAPMTASRELGKIVKRDLAGAMTALRMRLAELESRPTADKEIVCQSCGGHTQFTGTLTAMRCPYCNTPIQRDDVKDSPARLPLDGVLPLRVGHKTGRDLIEKWINSRRLAPNEFKKYRTLGSFSSVYLPYFNYDADTTTHYRGQRGEHYYVTVGSGDNRRTERRTRWYPASGIVHNTFRDVEGVASTQGLDNKKVHALEPWPMEQLVPFNPEFVAGHLSRTYDRDAAQVHAEIVEPRMRSHIETTCRRDIGGDEQRVTSMDVRYNALTYAHVLLPVWLLTVTYKEKPYQVFINGVTGEVQGYRPWSAIKIALLVILALIVITIAAVIYYYTQ
ncbi:hypothetical protein [Enemella sp. A6]|uniref:hypothetical protein n=1 Tax=Enemella sp. A6 TaxID=3440152 RepID=UPI003EC0D29F